MNIFISKNGEKLGPFNDQEIKEKLKLNEIADTDFCYQEGWRDWRLVRDVFQVTPPLPPQHVTVNSPHTLIVLADPSRKLRLAAYVVMGVCLLDYFLARSGINFLPHFRVFGGRDYTDAVITDAVVMVICSIYIAISKSKEADLKVSELIQESLKEDEKIIFASQSDVMHRISWWTTEVGTLVATNHRLLFIKTGEKYKFRNTVSWQEIPEVKFAFQISALKNVCAGFSSLTFLDADGLKRKITIGLGKASKWASVLNGKA
jgi:Bacterial PH domain/GYF domain 2